ncbi:MAG TPA: hypothetical protein VE153_41140 [Myxococcus sp.]|nr:hypothetical protein [Myxococcus sp.]
MRFDLFDIPLLQKQLAAAPIVSPYPHDLAVAIICDTFRLTEGVRPPTLADWKDLEQRYKHPLWKEQVAMLAHVLVSTSLREATMGTLRKGANTRQLVQDFFDGIEPLTAEMVRSNAFRQEEFLRKWVKATGGQVMNESARDSAARLEQLDYKKATYELKRAEHARKKEAEKREKLIAEAEKRAAEARGWRE